MITPNIIDTEKYTATVVPTIKKDQSGRPLAGIVLYIYANESDNKVKLPFGQVTTEFLLPPIVPLSMVHLLITHMFNPSDLLRLGDATQSEIQGSITREEFQSRLNNIIDTIVINSIN